MLGFGAGFVLTQFGLRWMLPWVGVAISIPTSTLLFWCLAPFFVDPGGGSLKAVVLFACVGLFFPGAAALLNFESNRLMGPNIAGALSSMTPVFAVLLAIVILGERVRGPQLLGLAAIVVGVGLMYRGHVSLSGRSLWLMALPLGASAIRGVIQPIVKFGFEWWPNPIAVVVISYTVSSAVLIFSALARAAGPFPISITAARAGLPRSACATVWLFWRCTPRSNMGRWRSFHRSSPAILWSPYC
jgi:uncharacterized membrane protein